MNYALRAAFEEVAFHDPFHANGLRYREKLIKIPYRKYLVVDRVTNGVSYQVFLHLFSPVSLFSSWRLKSYPFETHPSDQALILESIAAKSAAIVVSLARATIKLLSGILSFDAKTVGYAP